MSCLYPCPVSNIWLKYLSCVLILSLSYSCWSAFSILLSHLFVWISVCILHSVFCYTYYKVYLPIVLNTGVSVWNWITDVSVWNWRIWLTNILIFTFIAARHNIHIWLKYLSCVQYIYCVFSVVLSSRFVFLCSHLQCVSRDGYGKVYQQRSAHFPVCNLATSSRWYVYIAVTYKCLAVCIVYPYMIVYPCPVSNLTPWYCIYVMSLIWLCIHVMLVSMSSV